MTPALPNAKPDVMPGQADYHARCAVRDLILLYGFEEARAMVAQYLNEECERKVTYAKAS